MARKLAVHVVGARPNYMKVAPVYAALEQHGQVEQRLVHTGQHYDTLLKDVFFSELPLPRPHVQLEARTPASAVAELEQAFGEFVYLIAGPVMDAGEIEIRAYRLENGAFEPITIERC